MPITTKVGTIKSLYTGGDWLQLLQSMQRPMNEDLRGMGAISKSPGDTQVQQLLHWVEVQLLDLLLYNRRKDNRKLLQLLKKM